MSWMTRKQKIGVVGMYRSGKTVFLTSLINHILNHEKEKFQLGKKGDSEITGARPTKPRLPSGWSLFDYEGYRSLIANSHKWPQKTLAPEMYQVEFDYTGWFRSMEFRFADIPGERMADIIIGESSYAEWSDWMLKIFKNRPEYNKHAQTYLELIGSNTVQKPNVIKAYKHLLAKLILDLRPIISPSSFLVTADGRYLPEVTSNAPDELAAKAVCGFNRDFVPLPDRLEKTDTYKEFTKAYEVYKQKVVQPITNWLKNCQSLIVLVDVTTILSSGLPMYHSNQELMNVLIQSVDPGRELSGKLWAVGNHIFGRCLNGVTRLAFVATKSDKVYPSDRQKLVGLLRGMINKRIKGHEQKKKLKVMYIDCASVVGTAATPDGKLQARPMKRDDVGNFLPPKEVETMEYQPSRVPDDWPSDEWSTGQFRFPNIWPRIPQRADCAPEQINLNRIADFLLAESDWTE